MDKIIYNIFEFRVTKKNPFKRLRVKLSYEDHDYEQNRETQKSLKTKEISQYLGTRWNMRFYFTIQRMTFDSLSNKQSK